jgi:hypothetical protein
LDFARTSPMPIEWSIDKQRRLAMARVTGVVDAGEVVGGLAELVGHEDFVPGMPSVWDLSEADISILNKDGMKSVGLHNRATADRRGEAKAAIVSSEDLSFGVGRMLEVLSASPNLEIRVFRDLESAQEWALLPPADRGAL